MKKTLLMAGLLLALTASMASAVGIDLNWNNCLFGAPNRAADMAPVCDDPDPAVTNGQVFTMYGSVRTGVNIPGVIAWGADIDVQTAAAVLDPWWQLGAGECREGSIGYTFNGFTNSTSCNKTLMVTSPAPLGIANWASGQGGPNRAHYGIGVVRTTGVTVLGATKYQLFAASIDSRFTMADPNSPADPVCAGCQDAACIVLNHVEVDVPVAQQPPDGKNNYFAPEIANWVTWNGGGVSGGGCPGATPTRTATWGRVKSLYR